MHSAQRTPGDRCPTAQSTSHGRDEFEVAFRAVLLRWPRPDEIIPLRTILRTPAAVHAHLERGFEAREVVQPLAERLQRLAIEWQFTRMDLDQLCEAVERTRHLAGGDQAVRTGLRSGAIVRHLAFRPINLEVDVTNQCNLRCVMCPHSTPEYYLRSKAQMPVERFAELAAELFGVCHRLSLSYGTEPLLHRDFAELMKIACSHGVPRTYVNTNGLLLREDLVETMIDVGFGALCVSIDAATRETYERIRRGGNWTRLMANLRMVQRVRERRASERPEVQLAFVLRRDNVHELPAFIDLAADIGASGVVAMHMIPFAGLEDAGDTAFVVQEATNAALSAAAERATARGIRLVAPLAFQAVGARGPAAPRDTDAPRRRFDMNAPEGWARDRYCTFPWNFAAIDAHGNVLPCGWWYGEPPLGNIYRATFREIWHGAAYSQLRDELQRRRQRRACTTCPAAGMGNPDDPAAFAERGPAPSVHGIPLHYFEAMANDGERLTVRGWMLWPDGPAERLLLRNRAGEQVVLEQVRRPDLAAALPWIPGADGGGFHASVPLQQLDDGPLWSATIVGMRAGSRLGAVPFHYLAAHPDAPVPPPNLMEAVTLSTDHGFFTATGASTTGHLLKTAAAYLPLVGIRRWLDWGCGCGRQTRFLLQHLPSAEGHGADVDGMHLDWLRQHLPRGCFTQIEPAPPTPYEAESFDLVVANTVFTHMRIADQVAWTGELRRLLAPGGVLLATFHGAAAAAMARLPQIDATLQRDGYFDGLDRPEYPDHGPGSYFRATYQTADHVRSTWGRCFRVLEHQPGAIHGMQDLWVFAAPARE